MMLSDDIVNYYKGLCAQNENKYISRDKYLSMQPKYTRNTINKIWGNWANFIDYVKSNGNVSFKQDEEAVVKREEITRKFDKNTNRVVITYAINGSPINVEFFDTLKLYCAKNDAKLGIIWGKGDTKKSTFGVELYELLKPYLATEFEFEKDEGCVVKDFEIPKTKRNPLMNLDKLSTDINTIITGSTKQYLRILPYKQDNDFRVGCSTGTISLSSYKNDINGYMSKKHHKYGALLLEYNNEHKRYFVRNLIFQDGAMYDLNKKYTKEGVEKIKNVPAMILGDLHLPDEDYYAIKKTHEEFKELKPSNVIIHDLASWNSISHHELTKYYTRCKNKTPITMTLETELSEVLKHIDNFTKNYKNINFKVVNSNHDNFIEKWLDDGDFVKDVYNAKIGAKLFIDYLDNKNILSDKLPSNVSFMERNKSFKVCGYELAEHGDCGISGAKGSVNSFNKSFDKIVIGHTHSPEIFEQTVVVGTLSKLKLCYNQKGLTMWAQANVVLHENGSFQMLFL